MTTFLARMMGSPAGKPRPEEGAPSSPLGPGKPSGQLWLSELVTFAVYPRFVAKHGGRMLPAWVLTAGAVALAVYGLWTTIATSSIGSS